ncbi:hypothetical protein [Rathayibacter sp. AY1F6]|uniref:hypothetical protein n=1 Tax=Rathayibacter sp. AY1F6 TaxID=2080560 RepID=UPI0011B00EC9|nr:hypothetical protein [Rathayibacter sp. AY1F6]
MLLARHLASYGEGLAQARNEGDVVAFVESNKVPSLSIYDKVSLLRLCLGLQGVTTILDGEPVDVLSDAMAALFDAGFNCRLCRDDARSIWIEVVLAAAVFDYLDVRGEDLSVFEAKTLWGSPLSLAMAHEGVLTLRQATGSHEPYEYFLAAHYSDRCSKAEMAFFAAQWELRRISSPSIIADAESESRTASLSQTQSDAA